jgi:outer membrane protein assembly factor BamE (lipoprotein component of BamABCDE complex)
VTLRLSSFVRRLRLLSAGVTTILLASGCSWLGPPPQVRGNRVAVEQLQELVPGTSTRADVTALIGSPTTRAPFDDNTWIYVSEVTQPRIGRTLGVLDQHVVVLSFNEQGVLREVQTRGRDDALPVAVVERTTPSPGTEASFLQQLFGNIGRFNAGGLGASPGSSGAGASSAGGAPRPY